MHREENRMNPKIVIIGAGFAGYNALKNLEKYASADITVIDKCNHNVFQPMLYQVATGFIPITNVAVALRSMITHKTTFINDEVIQVDFIKKVVSCRKYSTHYDFLIIATGSKYFYFNQPQWKPHTLSLKTAYDAIKMKNHILQLFEKAEFEIEPNTKREQLTFTIIGGGATGVEICGAITDMVNSKFLKKFKKISLKDINVILIEAGDRLLSSFHEKSSQHAFDSLTKKNVTIKLNEKVTNIEENLVTTNKCKYHTKTIIWCASLISEFKEINSTLPMDEQGRIKVDKYLMTEKHKEIYCIGDTACAYSPDGKKYPGLASVAKQQGKFVANDIIARQLNKKRSPFKFRDYGMMAIISKHRAIAEFKKKLFGARYFHGRKGWFLWGFVHIYFILSIKNKLSIFINWMTYYFFNRLSSLLIITKNKNASKVKKKESNKD